MHLQRMSHTEVFQFFGSHREDGVIVEDNGLIVGVCGFNTYCGFFYVHSCFCCDPKVYAAIHRWMKQCAKEKGFKNLRFSIDHHNQPWFERALRFAGFRPITSVFEWEF